MFMRFRGGGVGHTYMRQVEPWLDATGWGTTWPSLKDREPPLEDELNPSPHNGKEAGPATSARGHPQTCGDDEDSGEEDDGVDIGIDELEDGDGEDQEQPEDDDDNEEEDDNEDTDKGAPPGVGQGEGMGDDAEEEGEEGDYL
jgi:hypothetical protein